MARASLRLQRIIELLLVLLLPIAAAGFIAWGSKMVGRAHTPALLSVSLALVGVLGNWVMRAKREHDAGAGRSAAARYPWRRRVGTLLAALVLSFAAVWVSAPAPLTSLSQRALELSFQRDAQLIEAHGKGLNAALAQLQRQQIPPPDDTPLSARQERVLIDTWRQLLNYSIALEGLRRFYEDYYRIDLDSRREHHLIAFLLTYAADATLYDVGSRFVAHVARNINAVRLLDAPRPGLGKGSLSRFRQKLIGYDEQVRFEAGKRYLPVVSRIKVAAERRGLTRHLRALLDRRLASVSELAATDRATLGTRAELQGLKRRAVALWYPLQKGVAEALGDTRVRRIGRYLIDKPLRDEAAGKLQPGDILLSRKNWYLSNVGLPGFWPHAILYLGEPETLGRYFDDPEVNAWLQAEAHHPVRFDRYLATRFPEAWKAYTTRHQPHHEGEVAEPPLVIEAISEGVVFSTLGECAGDYLAGLRPRLSKRDKAKALVEAFSHFGKPYDFEFDFATDHALVCTELVHRAYRPAPGRAGVDFTLREMAGRTTLPANDIAGQYAAKRNSPEAQLDFVLFIDAREEHQQAFLSDEDAFAATHLRPKWDIVQQ